ncbi:MAG: hypothetical protein ACFCGT_24805 [Sandaracinaceae bacterium]
MTEARLVEEARRVYRRYQLEVVEALGLCPYAAPARADERTSERVLTAARPSDPEVLDVIDELAADEGIDVAVVLFPRMEIDPATLARRVEVLRKAHAARRGGTTAMALEAFHPAAEADVSAPERLTPFLRRTPDPTIQATRLATLERVRRAAPHGTAFVDVSAVDLAALLEEEESPSVTDRIATANLRAVQGRGLAEVAALFDAILEDRDRSYAALDLEVPVPLRARGEP